MTQKCTDYLSNYQIGDDRLNQADLDMHAGACGACARDRAMLASSRRVAQKPDFVLDCLEDRVHKNVMDQIRSRSKGTLKGRGRYWLLAASCAMFVAGIYLSFVNGRNPEEAESLMAVPPAQTASPDSNHPIIVELLPPNEEWRGTPDHVRFIVRGLSGDVEQGEIQLDEAVLDTRDALVLPASINGL